MRSTSTGLREQTRSPTVAAGTGSSARTGAGRGPFSAVRHACCAPWVIRFGRRTQRTSGSWPRLHGHRRHVDAACGCSDRYDAIYVSDADGSNLHLVTSHAYNEYGFAWSPDGRSILYGRANREGIYVIGADGHNNHRLTRDSPTPTEFPALTWAPDGRSIAYETDRTGNGDIYAIGADGHNKVRLTNSAASDGSPSWEPR